jgi:hypothetical protein
VKCPCSRPEGSLEPLARQQDLRPTWHGDVSDERRRTDQNVGRAQEAPPSVSAP